MAVGLPPRPGRRRRRAAGRRKDSSARLLGRGREQRPCEQRDRLSRASSTQPFSSASVGLAGRFSIVTAGNRKRERSQATRAVGPSAWIVISALTESGQRAWRAARPIVRGRPLSLDHRRTVSSREWSSTLAEIFTLAPSVVRWRASSAWFFLTRRSSPSSVASASARSRRRAGRDGELHGETSLIATFNSRPHSRGSKGPSCSTKLKRVLDETHRQRCPGHGSTLFTASLGSDYVGAATFADDVEAALVDGGELQSPAATSSSAGQRAGGEGDVVATSPLDECGFASALPSSPVHFRVGSDQRPPRAGRRHGDLPPERRVGIGIVGLRKTDLPSRKPPPLRP